MIPSPVDIVLFLMIAIGAALANFAQWRTYRELLREQKSLRQRLDAVVSDRDEWRDVAQRALLVAQAAREAQAKRESPGQ